MDVEIVGEGRDLVLLHSLLSDRSSFMELAARLSGARRLILVNLPGFGASPPAEPLDGYADRVAETLDALGIAGPTDVLGNGLGGFVALILAVRHPAKVGKIVLIGGGVVFSEAGRATFRGLADKVQREGMASVADVAVKRMFSDDVIAAHPELIADRKAIFEAIDPAVFAAAARSLATLDLSEELSLIRSPVLIVVGEKDAATPPAMGRELAERLPDASMVELPGVGHAPHIHAVEEVVRAITPFLDMRVAKLPSPSRASSAGGRSS
jgi:3-oxoadipate enol-lactonase